MTQSKQHTALVCRFDWAMFLKIFDANSTCRKQYLHVRWPTCVWSIQERSEHYCDWLTWLYNSNNTSRKHTCIILTPLNPLLYSKTGVYRGIHFFLFLFKNIDCGYSLEPPRRGGSNEYPQSMFWAEIWKISEVFIWKFSDFWRWNFLCIWISMFS